MTGCSLEKLRRLAGRARDRLGARAAILLYHRVADTPGNPYLLRVGTRNFAEQMDVLRRHGNVLPLRELASRHRSGTLPHGAVAITFDDGYADNLHNAKPALEARGLPATVFMTAGTIGRDREFWWDELEQIVLGTTTLPPVLRAREVFGTPDTTIPHPGRPGGDQCWTFDPSPPVGHRDWDLTQSHDPTPRHKLLRDVHDVIRVMPHEPRQAVLDRLRAWAKAERYVRPEFRAMCDDEIRELAEGGLVEVGAHTVTHPSLPALPPDARREEITNSRRRLENVLAARVASFAYPYGDVDDLSVNAVAEAGFDTACTCDGRVTVPRSHRLRLPRFDVLDWDGDTFARHLERWLRA